MRLFDRLWSGTSEAGLRDGAATGPSTDDARKRARLIAPVVWLLGKTGAGKTAIVAALTGDPRAQVGEGFEPCTRTASFYDVPPEAPLLRFLDTRGIGEANYNPENDIAWCEGQSHLLLAVMQVSDPAQHTVLRALAQARRRHPDWPVVVAQTGLHRLYPPGMRHPEPYPYTGGPEDREGPAAAWTTVGLRGVCLGVSARLAKLPRFVPHRIHGPRKRIPSAPIMGSKCFGRCSRRPAQRRSKRSTSRAVMQRTMWFGPRRVR